MISHHPHDRHPHYRHRRTLALADLRAEFALRLATPVRNRGARVQHARRRLPRGERGLRRRPDGAERPSGSAASTGSPPSGTAPSGWARRASWPRRRGCSPASGCTRSASTTCATPRRARCRSSRPPSARSIADELARNPFRVFTSMLVTTDRRFFDAETQARLEEFIGARTLFGRELLGLADRSADQRRTRRRRRRTASSTWRPPRSSCSPSRSTTTGTSRWSGSPPSPPTSAGCRRPTSTT